MLTPAGVQSADNDGAFASLGDGVADIACPYLKRPCPLPDVVLVRQELLPALFLLSLLSHDVYSFLLKSICGGHLESVKQMKILSAIDENFLLVKYSALNLACKITHFLLKTSIVLQKICVGHILLALEKTV